MSIAESAAAHEVMWKPPEPWRSRIVSGLGLAAAAVLDRLSGGTLAPFYSLPVAFAALRGGWLDGAVAGGAAAVLVTLLFAAGSPARLVEGAALVALGLMAGMLVERDRRESRRYRKLAGQLSTVYEKVQANFEGMKRAERLSALGQLSAGLAHEIRNPLASISGAAAILQRNPDTDPKQARCVEIIVDECRRLNGLLTNFLDFARPRAPRIRTVKLEPVVDNVLALGAHGVRGKTVHLDRRIEPGLPEVECDPEQLEQVLLNLMINAIEASPDDGTVTLSAAAENGRVAIRVQDRGHGVAPAHVDRLFDPFFTTKEHGTGLGLPVAHQIMRQMGGSLLAEPNPDQGMTFAVILPASHHEP